MTTRNTRVGIVLAIYRPNIQFLTEQIDSILNQSYPYERIFIGVDEMTLDRDALELLSRLMNATIVFSKNQGSIRNFEILLNIALESCDLDLVFFSDQDDVWDPSKIERHVSNFEQSSEVYFCAYSDLSGINSDGREIQSSLFESEGRLVASFPFFNSVLRNHISGCTLSINRNLAKLVLPFPSELEQLGVHHDAWINAVIGAFGVSKFIDQPLVKYRQHSNNQIGMTSNKFRYKSIKSKIISYRIRRRLVQLVIHRAKSNKLELLNSCYKLFDSRPIYFLLLNSKVIFQAKNGSLYLDFLVGAIVSKFLVGLDFFKTRIHTFVSIFTVLKNLTFKFRSLWRSGRLRTVMDKVWNAPSIQENNVVDRLVIKSYLVPKSTKSVIVIVPHLPPEPIFGGISTALQLAFALAEVTGRRLIVVSANQKVQNISVTRELIGLLYPRELNIEIKDPLSPLLYDREDIFILTAWWTAEYISCIEREINFNLRKIYLIQDFEPNFYPWSSNYSRALSSYHIQARKVFNTNLLKDYFVELGLASHGDLSIKPTVSACTSIQFAPKNQEVNVVFYYRPSVARNMAALTIESLNYYITHRNSRVPVNFTSIGESAMGLSIAGIYVNSFGHIPLEKYTALLGTQDIGLSLMLSPHPSYPPLDMAASGIITISNTFENKIPGSIPLVKLVEPDVRAIGEALIASENQFLEGHIKALGKIDEISDPLGEYTITQVAEALSTWD